MLPGVIRFYLAAGVLIFQRIIEQLGPWPSFKPPRDYGSSWSGGAARSIAKDLGSMGDGNRAVPDAVSNLIAVNDFDRPLLLNSRDACLYDLSARQNEHREIRGKDTTMRRTTLLLLLATTATCYGQSNADTPADQPPSGPSYVDEDQPRLEQRNEEIEPIEQSSEGAGSIKRRNEETGRIEQRREEIGQAEQGDEEAGRDEQSSEETQRVEQNNAETEHLYRIRQDDEGEAMRRQQQPEDTFSTSVQHNLGRQYKQSERPSVPRAGHVKNSKQTYHTTPAPHKRLQDSSNKNYNQQSVGVHQGPKGSTNRN
jgi:hypothetical protein